MTGVERAEIAMGWVLDGVKELLEVLKDKGYRDEIRDGGIRTMMLVSATRLAAAALALWERELKQLREKEDRQ
jgi:hypothetical protein